jgi:hypothetical protein
MAGYIGKSQGVTQVDGYNRSEADAEFVDVTGDSMTGALTIDADGATVLTVDRATSDGTIIDLQKDGSSVGGLNASGSDLVITSNIANSSSAGLQFQVNNIINPTNQGNKADNLINLGSSNYRFKDLYLSGGVYLGGTGGANYLDDYEEGTWTPIIVSAGGTPTTNAFGVNGNYGYYTKVGNIVTAHAHCIFQRGTATGYIDLGGLPFTSANVTTGYASTTTSFWNIATAIVKLEMHLIPNSTQGNNTTRILTSASSNVSANLQSSDINTGDNTILYSITYLSS